MSMKLQHGWMVGLALVVSGCGGEATAVIKLMDAPPEGITAVTVFVDRIEVHVAEGDKAKDGDPADTSIDQDRNWESLAYGKALDLLAHQGEGAAALLGELSLPEGKITQVRLFLDLSQSNTVVQDGVECALELADVPPTGIKINHPFKAFAAKDGAETEILMDFDVGESLIPSGDCYRLRPVLKLHKVKVDGKEASL